MGDWVYARDEDFNSDVVHRKQVIELFRYEDRATLDVTITGADGQAVTLRTTPEHPFAIEGQGWVPAGELVEGQHTIDIQGRAGTVTRLERVSGLSTVHNFAVADDHTYFVSELGVWVHNRYDGIEKAKADPVQKEADLAEWETYLGPHQVEGGTLNLSGMEDAFSTAKSIRLLEESAAMREIPQLRKGKPNGLFSGIAFRYREAKYNESLSISRMQSADFSLNGAADLGLGLLGDLGAQFSIVASPITGAIDTFQSLLGGRGFDISRSDRHDTDFVVTVSSLALAAEGMAPRFAMGPKALISVDAASLGVADFSALRAASTFDGPMGVQLSGLTDDALVASSRFNFGIAAERGALSKAEQLALNRLNGIAFEEAGIRDILSHVGLGKNTTAVTRNGVTTIFDSAGRPAGLVEFKNVQYLTRSDQLTAQLGHALETGQPYNLVVSPTTQRISQPLLDQVRAVNRQVGGGIYRYDPATGVLTTWPK